MAAVGEMGQEDEIRRQPAEDTAKSDKQQKPRQLAFFQNNHVLHNWLLLNSTQLHFTHFYPLLL